MLRILVVLTGLLLFSTVSKAQNLMDDLKKVSSILDTVETVRIDVVCKVYSKKEGELLTTVNTGMIKKGKKTVSFFDDFEIFMNERYGVYVNHEDKSITVISKDKYASRMKSIDNKSVDQFVNWMKKQENKTSFNPKLLSDAEGIRTYSITGLSDLKELIVVIDVTNHKIERISYEFEESSKQKQKYILLNYSKFIIDSKEIQLDSKDYYIQQSGKFLPGNKYKSYSITTNL